MSFLSPPRPRVFGHRGAAGLAPENTLPSFAVARSLGIDYLELDVHGTRDGVIVVLHDGALDRTTDGSGEVSDTSWATVSALDAGFRFTHDDVEFPFRGQGIRVPTLESVLLAHPGARFNIEIKQSAPGIVEEAVAQLHRTDSVGRVLLAAEKDPIMAQIRHVVGGEIPTGSSVGDVLAFVERLEADDWEGYQHPGIALQIPPAFGDRDLVTHESVAAAHRLGVEVHVWTINDRAEIERLLDLGVDGIISDDPGLARAVVESYRDR